MSKQTYPAYRVMAFDDDFRGGVITLHDTWHDNEFSARRAAAILAAQGDRTVVFLEARVDFGVRESLLWESQPGTITWLDGHTG